mgnify:CR=1 FL=1
MSEKIPNSVDDAIGNVTGKVTETAGDLLDAALTYAGRNVIKRYKFNKADDDFQLAAYKQAQEQALTLQKIKNEKIQQYFEKYIENNIQSIAEKTLGFVNQIPEQDRLVPNIDLIGTVFEEAKYKTEPDIIKMFSKLLASSIDVCKVKYVHPSFVHVISEMSPLDAENISLFLNDEGKLPIAQFYFSIFLTDKLEESQVDSGMKCNIDHAFMANKKCNDEKALSSSLVLLEKHGLISLKYEEKLVNIKSIKELDDHFEFTKYSHFKEMLEKFDNKNGLGAILLIRKGFARLTNYGESFLIACIEGENIENFIKDRNKINFSTSYE